jgi:hypothetical protein
MSTIELRKKLIDKIKSTENRTLLEEALRLLALESDDSEIYVLSTDQLNSVQEAQAQIKNGKLLTDDQANQEIDEWLGK